jgi:cation transport regulator ChaB
MSKFVVENLKGVYIVVLMFMCVSLTSCVYLTKQNPNVETPLDSAIITYSAMVDWYIGAYNEVSALNTNVNLPIHTKIILRSKVNPAMDSYKQMLIDYGALIEVVQAHSVLSSADVVSLETKAKILEILKGNIINFLIQLEQR